MQTLSEILEFLRAATTAEQYALSINRLREVETDLGELRSRMETAEEAAIFSGDDPSLPRDTIRQCDDDLRTIQVAIAGAERRMHQAALSEDADEINRLGDKVAADAATLAGHFRDVRKHIESARTAIFEAIRLTAVIDNANQSLSDSARRDLIRRPSQIRREAMGEDVPRAPHTVRGPMRRADDVLVEIATGKRPWMSAAASLVSEPLKTNLRVLDHPQQRRAIG